MNNCILCGRRISILRRVCADIIECRRHKESTDERKLALDGFAPSKAKWTS